MLSRVNEPNKLARRVATDPNMTRRAKIEWQKMDCSDMQFPRLDIDYLQLLACGTYQIKQARGFVAEHLTPDGDYQIWLHQHSPNMVRAQIRSRHKSQTKYNAWIEYSNDESDSPIHDYYCVCPTGKQTV